MEYSKIYKQLVKDKEDPAQVIAYSLYKTEKIQYIEKKKAEKAEKVGVDISQIKIDQKDLKNFYDTITEARLDSFRQEGNQAVMRMSSKIIVDTLRKEKEKDYSEIIKQTKDFTLSDFCRELGIGILGSVLGGVVSWLIACAYFDVSLSKNEGQKQEQTLTLPKHPEFNQAPSKTAK